MRASDSVNSHAGSVASDWAEYEAVPHAAHLEGARPTVLRQSTSDSGSPSGDLQQEMRRLQKEQEETAAKLKVSSSRDWPSDTS